MKKSQKHVAVFGCGYVGTEIAREALARGYRVTALTRNPDTGQVLTSMGVDDVLLAELQNDDWHDKISSDVDIVVNCVSSAGNGLEGYKISYLAGQESLLKWCQNRTIQKFLYTSATSVYAQSQGETVNEASSLAKLSPNGEILLESEELVLQANLEQSYVTRLSGIYGPGRHFLLNRLKSGSEAFPGTGEQYLNLIYRDDICNAIWHLMDSPNIDSGIYNVSDDSEATKKQMVEWLAQQLDRPKPLFDPEMRSSRDQNRRGEAGRLPNRIVSNQKLKSTGWMLKFPTYREGFAALI